MSNFTPPPSKRVKYGIPSSPASSSSTSAAIVIGYIQHVMPVKQNQASSNLYFDVKVQTANQESKIVKVMHQKGDGCKRHIFVDKMNAQQPVKISNLSVTASGTMFCNKGAGIQDLPSHTITFQYEVQDPFEVTMVNSLMKSTTGNFNVCGSIKWKGEAKRPPNSSVMQRLQIPVGLFRCLYGVSTLLLSKKETSTHSQNVNCGTFMGSASQLLNPPQCLQPKNKT
ncbi:PREDICTED: uncharacterized protein LOC107343079 [Acropora digitifera]|uniref:uncharacterized protein LOC107343079 n=1 Tax=Acropora digitifera TaxID=70779 RepID=UPI00077B08E0|nr:PREDICTED: uncharacterized protein LOC107343079 [Acropora digitifera]